MSERPIADVGPLACPFVAFEHDQARRSIEPDRRHRCYAEPSPAPRAIAHQTTYCLSSGFSACPTFRAWARRTAARQAEEGAEPPARPAREVPVVPMPKAPDAAAMGLVTDDARPALGAGSDPGRELDELPRRAPRTPEWATPPPWTGSSAGREADGDDEWASPVGPIDPSAPEIAIDQGEVPGFLAGRPAPSPTGGATRSSSSGTPSSAASGAAGARPRSSVGQARPVSRTLRRPARIDADAPPWETPRRFEAYPTLRTRVGMPRIPVIALAVVAIIAAALLLFVLPSIVAGPTTTPTPTPRSSVATEAPNTPEPSPTQVAYTVAAGDTISKIAKKFGVSAEELLAANPQIKNANKIKVGDEMTIPAPEPALEPSAEASPDEAASPSP